MTKLLSAVFAALFLLGSCADDPKTVRAVSATTTSTSTTTSTTVPPTTTTTARPRPTTTRPPRPSRAAPAPRQAPAPVKVASGDAWVVLADCESGDGTVGPPFSYNLRAVGSGKFYGAFQFMMSTWRNAKPEGAPADPRDATWGQQLAAAQKVGLRESQFPSCYRRMKAAGYV